MESAFRIDLENHDLNGSESDSETRTDNGDEPTLKHQAENLSISSENSIFVSEKGQENLDEDDDSDESEEEEEEEEKKEDEDDEEKIKYTPSYIVR